jgi:hypothetical protein
VHGRRRPEELLRAADREACHRSHSRLKARAPKQRCVTLL